MNPAAFQRQAIPGHTDCCCQRSVSYHWKRQLLLEDWWTLLYSFPLFLNSAKYDFKFHYIEKFLSATTEALTFGMKLQFDFKFPWTYIWTRPTPSSTKYPWILFFCFIKKPPLCKFCWKWKVKIHFQVFFMFSFCLSDFVERLSMEDHFTFTYLLNELIRGLKDIWVEYHYQD